MPAQRFHGQIAGVGSTSGVRVVIGAWQRTPLGSFGDAMVETAEGHRVLLAPSAEVAAFIEATYAFDEVRIQPICVSSEPGRWRVESPSHLIAMGLDGSLDGAFRSATANMAQWLTEDYKLTPSEIAEVFGSAAEYKGSEVADRNAGIVLKISKERLKSLTPATQ